MIEELNSQLKEAMLSQNIELRRAIRNIKSDFIYELNQNSTNTFDIVIKLYNKRINTMKIYQDTNEQLFKEEQTELTILEKYLPTFPLRDEVNILFDSMNLEKKKSNFRKYKEKYIETYGFSPDTEIINLYIDGK